MSYHYISLATVSSFLQLPNTFGKLLEPPARLCSASSRQNREISSKSEQNCDPKIAKSRFERILSYHYIGLATVSRFLQLPNTFGKLLEPPARHCSASSRQNREISSESEQKCAPKIAKSRFERILSYHYISLETVSSFLQLPNTFGKLLEPSTGLCGAPDEIVENPLDSSNNVLLKSLNLSLNQY